MKAEKRCCKEKRSCYRKMKQDADTEPEIISESEWLFLSISSLGFFGKLFCEVLLLPTLLAEILSFIGTFIILLVYWLLMRWCWK